MYSNEARVAAVKERVRAKEQQRRLWLAAGVLTVAGFLAGAVFCRSRL